MKPELLIGLSLEVDTGPKEESFQAKAAPARRGKGYYLLWTKNTYMEKNNKELCKLIADVKK